MKKIVLAYSGGLDTSVIIKWLKDKYGAEVIAFVADLGQGKDLNKVKEKALKTGASKVYLMDLKKEFLEEYVLPAVKANAVYEGKYLMATALGRPLIAKKLVEIAKKEKASAVSHGSTGKGNDQVRFEVSIMALDPKLKIVAPVREWEFKSREEEIDYAKKHGIKVEATKKSPYSIDRNIWGISIECGVLENPWKEPPENVYQLTKSPKKAPGKPTYVTLEFKKGKPIGLNGNKMDFVKLVTKLNKIAGDNGVGRVDMVENRLVGIKSREIYEFPAATVIHLAHKELEALTLDRETFHFKQSLVTKYSEMVYYGLWFTPLKKALDAFFDKTQETVTGIVKLKLFKGKAEVVGRKSKFSLYDFNLATYEEADAFDHKASKGFVDLWGLPYKVMAQIKKK